ncbi:hypothetical protein [Novosphingobium sp. HII-3]|uniref:hypothetical protein n=1 Tax=Novosphingobium sp. HII-3 TaxID=2075565 RepID=UPI0013048937|nr:hypothetical protein [Novosphingobium sp. HII-3]
MNSSELNALDPAILATSAKALRDAGLLGQAEYQRIKNKIEARACLRRLKDIVA